MRLSRREVLLVGVCVVVVAFIGMPTLKQLQSRVGGKSLEQLAREGVRRRGEIARLQQETQRLQQQVKDLTWPGDPDRLPPVLLKELHATAAQAGVTLASFRPGRLLAVASGSKLPITVQVQAPFPKAAAFLARLQTTQERVAVERVQFASSDANTDIVGLELRLAAYSTTPPDKGKQGGRS